MVLLLTPHQITKDDIYSIAKPYLTAADISCLCIYENDEKTEQIEKLKSSNLFLSLNNLETNQW